MTKRVLVPLALLLIGLALGWLAAAQWPGDGRDTGAGRSGVADVSYRAGPFKLGVAVDPEKPVVGDNSLRIRLLTRADEPVSDARIDAVAEMPAMGDMPAMRAPAEMRELRPGLYEGAFEPAMAGSWPLTLRIEHDLGSAKLTFDMATGRRGLRLTGGARKIGGDARREREGTAVEDLPPGTVSLDARRRRLIGVKTETAEERVLARSIRAYGEVRYDETRLSDISLKYDSWIGTLEADFKGKRVQEGEPLFTIFGPDLYAAQQEFLEVARRRDAASLKAAARQRLRLWGLTEAQIDRLAERGRPEPFAAILAPRNGVVVISNVVAGTGVKAGATLMRIADLSRVWVEAAVYEGDLALIAPDMPATIVLPHGRAERIEGEVDYVYPNLNRDSRTGRVRLIVPNPDGALRPGQYAEVKLHADLGKHLAVSDEAVLVAGARRVVFVDLGDGRLAPRYVKTGYRARGMIEIRSGLEAGERVVTSGNFLIASESRLKAGLTQW